MICRKCGAEVPDTAEYCFNCGAPLTADNINTDEYYAGGTGNERTRHFPVKTLRIILIILAIVIVVAAAVVIIVNVVSSRRTTVKLDDYVTISSEGYNGMGTAACDFDRDAFIDDYRGKIKLTPESEEDGNITAELGFYDDEAEMLAGRISGTLSKESGLSNGDTVTFVWQIENDIPDIFKVDLVYSNMEFTIRGLTEIPPDSVDFGQCGSDLYWFINEEGVLTITGSGPMDDYSAADRSPWYSYLSFIKSVALDADLTTIGSYAFSDCASLAGISIPDSVTNIGEYAFSDCAGLSEVELSDSLTYIGSYSFVNCSGIQSLSVPDSVTGIDDYAFENCTGLTEVSLGTGLSAIGKYCFEKCTSLKSAAGLDSVSSIGEHAFDTCSALTEVTLNESLSGIKAYTFSNCTSLTGVRIPDRVTTIETHAFYYCESLQSIAIPDSVTSIGDSAFQYCSGLSSATFGKNLSEIGSKGFGRCDSLTEITFTGDAPSFVGGCFTAVATVSYPSENDTWDDKVKSMFEKGSVFVPVHYDLTDVCGEDVSWTLDAEGTLTISGSGPMYDYDSTETPWFEQDIHSVVIEEGVTTVGNSAFESCSGLESVSLPESITQIGSSAFAYTDIESITFGSSLESIGDTAFRDCGKLTKIVFTGEAPQMGNWCFNNVTATAYYPSDQPSWDADALQDHGGTIRWEAD